MVYGVLCVMMAGRATQCADNWDTITACKANLYNND